MNRLTQTDGSGFHCYSILIPRIPSPQVRRRGAGRPATLCHAMLKARFRWNEADPEPEVEETEKEPRRSTQRLFDVGLLLFLLAVAFVVLRRPSEAIQQGSTVGADSYRTDSTPIDVSTPAESATPASSVSLPPPRPPPLPPLPLPPSPPPPPPPPLPRYIKEDSGTCMSSEGWVPIPTAAECQDASKFLGTRCQGCKPSDQPESRQDRPAGCRAHREGHCCSHFNPHMSPTSTGDWAVLCKRNVS